jgi:hypothetical protein
MVGARKASPSVAGRIYGLRGTLWRESSLQGLRHELEKDKHLQAIRVRPAERLLCNRDARRVVVLCLCFNEVRGRQLSAICGWILSPLVTKNRGLTSRNQVVSVERPLLATVQDFHCWRGWRLRVR